MKQLLSLLLGMLAILGIADQVLADHSFQFDGQISRRLPRKINRHAQRPFDGRPKKMPSRLWTSRVANRTSVRMPGEFEKQQFLLLSCGELTVGDAKTIANITVAVHRHVRVVVLTNSDDQQTTVIDALRRRVRSTTSVSFLRLSHDTKWIRDFGPTVLRKGAESVIVDWQYDQIRPNDDAVPINLAAMSSTPYEFAPLQFEGGNLLSNGHGLCVTTAAMTERNADYDLNERALSDVLKNSVGARQVVVLEPLAGEDTGHVDMFMTFISPTTAVVGAYSPKEDPENAALLDRNAARLALAKTPWGRLRVERIPMGTRRDGLWRTYTNCIYANGVLLVPVYQDGDDSRALQALTLYRRLLPRWHVVPVDATQLIQEGGALHCASLNVPCLSGKLEGRCLRIDNSTTPLIEVLHYSLTGKTSTLPPMRQIDATAIRLAPELNMASHFRFFLRNIW